jgi:extracellular elastinolytic metalloproteinase
MLPPTRRSMVLSIILRMPHIRSSEFNQVLELYSVLTWYSPWGLNDPSEGSRAVVTNPWDTTASEFGWQGTGSTTYNVPRGNNAIAQSNPSGGTAYLNNYRPTNTNQNFSYPFTTTMTPPSSFVDASITQLFYTANTYHDLLYKLGFTEKAGNFEVNNNGQGGTGKPLSSPGLHRDMH